MSDPAQRTEWAEHLRDEALAIARQQADAGATHEPVTGPLPYTHDDVTAAIRSARMAERDRCVRLVESLVTNRELAQMLVERLRAGEPGES